MTDVATDVRQRRNARFRRRLPHSGPRAGWREREQPLIRATSIQEKVDRQQERYAYREQSVDQARNQRQSIASELQALPVWPELEQLLRSTSGDLLPCLLELAPKESKLFDE